MPNTKLVKNNRDETLYGVITLNDDLYVLGNFAPFQTTSVPALATNPTRYVPVLNQQTGSIAGYLKVYPPS